MIKYHILPTAQACGCKFDKPRKGDAGYDIYASEHVILFAGEQKTVATGLVIQLPELHVGIIKDRSSMALRGLHTHGGVIDSSYRGFISVLVEYTGKDSYHIEPGQRIAQMLIVPIVKPDTAIVEFEDLTVTERGNGAFGSTGK